MNQKHPPKLFFKKSALKILEKFIGKHLYQGRFLNKVLGLRQTTASETYSFVWTPLLNNFTVNIYLFKVNNKTLEKVVKCVQS